MRPDAYARLRPLPRTPPDELCPHRGAPLKLMSALTPNPMHCMICNREVPPDTLGLPAAVIDALANWRDVYDALDRLWLDSGPYETWARAELSDIGSAANARGRSVQREIDAIRRCYYWYSRDQSADDYRPLIACPVCAEPLLDDELGRVRQRVCERDGIVVPA